MRTIFLNFCFALLSVAAFSQAGHVMQGVGAINMSMGGAATAQPIDINGAILWNPAAISVFNEKSMSVSAGAFFSSPELSSSLPAGALGVGAPAVSGTTLDDRGISVMPAFAMVWGKEGSKHTYGFSAFGISGFGVTFPEETNNPMSPSFNPTVNSNPINYPQAARGFGLLESDYMLLQISFTYAYQLTDKIAIGFQPNIDYAALQLAPNPLASPDFPPPFGTGKGYPVTDKASAIGYGAQMGVFYNSGKMLKLGMSYKTKQSFGEFDFEQTYLDDSAAPNVQFTMNYPAIFSVGMGLSKNKIDFALDYRFVDYENTEAFGESGWKIATTGPATGFPTGAVNGFGWQNMQIISAGLQYQLTEKMPVRIGYTYSSNAIKDELAFFSASATAVINDAAQLGIGYVFSDKLELNAVYHHGFRGAGVSGELLSPEAITATNPLGAMPGTNVSYTMETSLIQFTLNYTFGK